MVVKVATVVLNLPLVSRVVVIAEGLLPCRGLMMMVRDLSIAKHIRAIDPASVIAASHNEARDIIILASEHVVLWWNHRS